MYNLQEISKKGEIFLQQFSEIDFVGEIEIPEAELEKLCTSIWKSIYRISLNENLCALLTTVVVNLAYYTREDFDSNSFRWLVLNKLSKTKTQDNDIWVDYIGSPVLRTLKTHFDSKDISGPNRYVRPIMQQAGIPYSTVSQFVSFFLQLANQSGVPFSFQDYEKFRLRHRVQSHTLSNFLATETGFHYCKEIGRIFKNFRNGLLTSSEISKLPPRIRETVKVLCERSKEMPRAKLNNLPAASPPQLALDKDRYCLKLLFPFDGFGNSKVNYQLENSEPVYQSSYFLQPEELSRGKISGSVSSQGITENWEVDIWHPETNPWAIFSISSGIYLQSSGKINSGEYLVIIPAEYNLPDVIENYGYFYYPGNISYRIFHARLNDGFEIPEIGFVVGANSSASPHLFFSDSKNAVRYGVNVFLEKTPQIRIDNWSEDTLNNYFLRLDQNGKTMRIPENQVSDGILNCSFNAPAQAQLRLEPKGKTVKNFRPSNLYFSVIPKDFQFLWKNLLYEKNACPQLEIKPIDRVKVECKQIIFDSPGKWRVIPKIDSLELLLKYDNSTQFSLTVPVYRLTIFSEIIENNLLWQEKLNQRVEIEISLSPNERRQNVEIGIITATGFIKICDSRPVSNNLLLQITTDEIRDAFDECGLPAGIIAIKTRYGNLVKSDVVYANEKLIKSRSFDPDEKFKEWAQFLPDDLRSSIDDKRTAHLLCRNQRNETSQNIPDSIKDWLDNSQPDFEITRKSVRDWSQECRAEYWQKAQKTEIGREPEGKILIEAVKIYHDALHAFENQNLPKFNRSLESAYHQLNTITRNPGLISQIASFIRFLCCLRLEEFSAMKDEIILLDENWTGVFSLLQTKFPTLVLKNTTEGKNFSVDDILIHQKDFEFFEREKL